jgi:hypothetical protein
MRQASPFHPLRWLQKTADPFPVGRNAPERVRGIRTTLCVRGVQFDGYKWRPLGAPNRPISNSPPEPQIRAYQSITPKQFAEGLATLVYTGKQEHPFI